MLYNTKVILLLYKDKAGFCLYALNKKTTQSIGTKLFLNIVDITEKIIG